jgi:hypothetical protein
MKKRETVYGEGKPAVHRIGRYYYTRSIFPHLVKDRRGHRPFVLTIVETLGRFVGIFVQSPEVHLDRSATL